ncbi:MAG: hypothetical protein M1830_002836 [Pleopsidium flavum]|nr:MAG: hypothetical protein M1830_002836 [Pleopsidium flavum]
MAPARTPGRKTREMDYSNVGKQGRKTGITVQDTGVRDEHGLELIDGLFSSPEKSSRRPNGITNNTTISSEEDMDLGDSTVPEPTDVLTERRSGRPILPPPRSRSPIKTSLNSAARRSVGPISSPSRRVNDTPTRAVSHPAVNRRLDFSTEELRPSIERSPQKGGRPGGSTYAQPHAPNGRLSVASYSGSQPSSSKGRKRPFDLRANEDEESATFDDGEVHQMNGVAEVDDPVDIDDESMRILQDHDDEDDVQQEQPDQESDDDNTALLPPPKRKQGRPRKILAVGSEGLQNAGPAAKKGGRRVLMSAPIDLDASQISIPEAKPPRGRPPKNPKPTVFQDEEQEDKAEEERPTKRAKNTSVNSTPLVGRPRKGTKPPPSQRDPNAKVTSAKKIKAKTTSVEPEVAQRSNGRPKPRSLYIMRSGTPAEDGGSRITRSGRTSVKPLAYWRNERIVYGEDDAGTSERYLLPTIKEVIRTEEVEQPRPKKAKGRSKAAGKKRQLEDLEEEDEEQEPWEMEEGIRRGLVTIWNSVQGPDEDEEEENAELAYAHAAIQTREVHNSTFRYAKTLTLPFFGSGMVDLPPNGQKKRKNSRKMQMAFFVFYGRVVVEVGENTFSIGKGGMWQVPRGNLYSITNQYDQPARIFFAQGCEVFAGAAVDEMGPPSQKAL